MLSAFGVDHGDEFSKGRFIRPRNPMRGMPGGKRATRAQVRTQGTGGPSGPQKVKDSLNRVTEASISLKGIGEGSGKAIGATGGFIQRHPGVTGTALVGGGGAAGYKLLDSKNKKAR